MRNIVANVICSKANHKLLLTPGGAIGFLDHPSLSAEITADAIGESEPCGCMRTLLAYRGFSGGKDWKVNAALLGRAVDASSVRRQRREAAWNRGEVGTDGRVIEKTIPDLESRLASRIYAAAEKSLDQCSYRRSKSKWVGGKHTVVIHVTDLPGATGGSVNVYDDKPRKLYNGGVGYRRGTNSFIDVSLKRDWLRRVYRAGLAVIDGQFILDVYEDGKVLAVKQARGHSVTYLIAKVVDRDGRQRLRWEK